MCSAVNLEILRRHSSAVAKDVHGGICGNKIAVALIIHGGILQPISDLLV